MCLESFIFCLKGIHYFRILIINLCQWKLFPYVKCLSIWTFLQFQYQPRHQFFWFVIMITILVNCFYLEETLHQQWLGYGILRTLKKCYFLLAYKPPHFKNDSFPTSEIPFLIPPFHHEHHFLRSVIQFRSFCHGLLVCSFGFFSQKSRLFQFVTWSYLQCLLIDLFSFNFVKCIHLAMFCNKIPPFRFYDFELNFLEMLNSP